jgi:hypothetical protein
MVPQRSVTLYVIVTIISGGIFGIYWLYALIEDPNKHFIQHVSLEDSLMEKLPQLQKTP